MGRITRAAVAALAAFLLTGATGAAADDSLEVPLSSLAPGTAQLLPDNQAADIYGVGGGKTNNGLQKFNLSAHEGPDGDFGHVSVTFYDPFGSVIVSYSVDVTCVNIHTYLLSPYNRGVIVGRVKTVAPVPNALTLNVGSEVLFSIKDGGNPSNGPVDDFDAPSIGPIPPGFPCKEIVYPGNLNNVTQGNVNIKGP